MNAYRLGLLFAFGIGVFVGFATGNPKWGEVAFATVLVINLWVDRLARAIGSAGH